jgi:hypothetical protein
VKKRSHRNPSRAFHHRTLQPWTTRPG